MNADIKNERRIEKMQDYGTTLFPFIAYSLVKKWNGGRMFTEQLRKMAGRGKGG